MSVALLSSKRSKDPNTQVGACIVNHLNRIVGVGYNGMPFNCSDDEFPWLKDKDSDPYDTKYLYVCHAEMNAICNSNQLNMEDCRIYVTLFPCNECAKLIIQKQLKEIIYLNDKSNGTSANRAAKRMFDSNSIKHRLFEPSENEINLTFRK
ncbi:hypothetical protein SNEBB_000361 [Seison nebaliae]|nr:hypothetical protein SNEBB_000361 [Seison nebaliae]